MVGKPVITVQQVILQASRSIAVQTATPYSYITSFISFYIYQHHTLPVIQ